MGSKFDEQQQLSPSPLKCNGESQSGKLFDLSNVHTHFTKAFLDSQEVHLKHYCDAWHELIRFMDTLGTLFHFVTHDVKQKLDILEAYLKADPDHYQTIHSVLRYEVENSLTKTKKPSGSRTILRLHRALKYILVLFEKLVSASNETKCSTLSHEAYNGTLGKFHPWIVRKAATLAMYSLPYRGVLLQRMDSSEGSEERVVQLLQDITQSGMIIYDSMDNLYTKEKLHDLP